MKQASLIQPLFGDHTSMEDFWARHWRQEPIFVKRGAEAFFQRWSGNDFDRALIAARRAQPSRQVTIREREGEVCFIESVSAVDLELSTRAEQLAGIFGSPRAWFDAIRTYSRSGIGAHFDHSDNMVLQQRGVKHWSLAPPSHISRDDYAGRMLDIGDVGGQELPAGGVLHFTLEPGDLLYIPLMWLHSGVSEGESLSISLVCPAVSLSSAVTQALSLYLRNAHIGFQAIGAVPDWVSEDEKSTQRSKLERAVRAVLGHIADDDVVARLVDSIYPQR